VGHPRAGSKIEDGKSLRFVFSLFRDFVIVGSEMGLGMERLHWAPIPETAPGVFRAARPLFRRIEKVRSMAAG
jgi:hypothetical protein